MLKNQKNEKINEQRMRINTSLRVAVGQLAANKPFNPHRITMRCLDNQPLALLGLVAS